MKKRGILLGAALLLLALLIWAIGAGKAAPAAPTAAPAPAEETAASDEQPVPAEEQSAPESAETALRFSTTAFDGSEVDESILSEATVTMLNFFEPW